MFDPTSVSDGAALADVLVQLAPDFFTPSWRGKIISETGGKWKLKVCYIQHVLSFLSSFELVWTPDPSGRTWKVWGITLPGSVLSVGMPPSVLMRERTHFS